MAWTYSIAGLTAQAEIPLPALAIPATAPDFAVRLASGQPPSLLHPVAGGSNWALSDKEFLLSTPRGAHLHVRAEGDLTLWAHTPEQYDEARAWVPGTGFTAVFVFRGRVALHAGAVRFGGKAFLILGPSGAGKSTLTAAFAVAGGQVMADDLVAPEWRDARPFLHPVFPGLRLLADAAAALGLDGEPGADGKICLAPPDQPPEPAPVGGLFLLAPREAGESGARRLTWAEALPFVLRELKGITALAHFADRERIFNDLAALCRTVPVYRVASPSGVAGLPEFARRLAGMAINDCRLRRGG